MIKSIAHKLMIGLLCGASFGISLAYAETPTADAENIEVTPDHNETTPEELAAIYVLSQLCTGYGYDKEPGYKEGYASLVKENMPDEKDPVQALEQRAKQKDFQKYIIEAQSDAKKAGDQQNKDICGEISTLNKDS
ncbi:MCR_0457 family protein [Acinetobacter sp. MB5]|uniref:MCR_0457 family protein n=1 Tax=Acinetobacter sp. MB5 TaxID=2069438 RepID=UPI000DD0EB8D|nr:hypothetical protein [Acinetobacter sp. MB5]